MSALSLENIIQKSYHDIMNGDLRQFCDKMSKIAAFILADIYETYESNKDGNSLIELRTFLNIRDPIKHLISILQKMKTGAVSIKHAIIDEIRVIKTQEHLMMKKFTLLDVIDEELNFFKKDTHRLRNPESLAQSVIDKLTLYRIEGHLNQDAESALMMPEIKATLTDIIRKVIDGEDLKDILLIYYRALDEKKRMTNSQLDEHLARFKVDMLQLIQCEFGEVHNHLGIMGEQIYNAATGLGESENELQHQTNQQMYNQTQITRNHHSQVESGFVTPHSTKRNSSIVPDIHDRQPVRRQPRYISNPSYTPNDDLFDM